MHLGRVKSNEGKAHKSHEQSIQPIQGNLTD